MVWTRVCVLLAVISLGVSLEPCPSSCVCHSKHNLTCSSVPNTKLSDSVLFLKMTGDIPAMTTELTSLMGDMLQVLDLSNTCIRHIEPDALHSKPDLVFLNLEGNHLRQIPPDLLQYNTKLEKLYLGDNTLEEVPDHALGNCHSLKLLELQHNRLRRVPSHLPQGLEILDVSSNNIDAHPRHLSKLSLRFLDLCDNPLRLSATSDVFNIGSLKAICIGYHHVALPADLGTHLSQLEILYLKGRNDTEKTALDAASLTSIGSLSSVYSLALENYVLESLEFLSEMKKLETLRLLYSDLMIPAGETVTLSKQPDLRHLQQLSLKGSSRLVQAFLGDPQYVTQMEQLEHLSLRNTGLVSLPQQHTPESILFIDLSDNPLRCDCSLAWLQNEMEKNLAISRDATCDSIEGGHHAPVEQHRRHGLRYTKDHADTKPLLKFLSLKLDCAEGETGRLELVYNDHSHSKMTSDDEENNILIYIILIAVLAVLIVIGLVLGIVLCLYRRKKREVQILPEESCSAPIDGSTKTHSTTIFVKREPST